MKKLLLIIALASFAISCEGPQGPQGPQGPRGYEGEIKKIFDWVTVEPNQWVRQEFGDGSFYRYEFSVFFSEFSQEVFDEGIYYSYMEFEGSDYILGKGLTNTIYFTQGNIEWASNVSVEYEYDKVRKGTHVAFLLNNEDGSDKRPVDDVNFRVIAIW